MRTLGSLHGNKPGCDAPYTRVCRSSDAPGLACNRELVDPHRPVFECSLPKQIAQGQLANQGAGPIVCAALEGKMQNYFQNFTCP